MRFSRQEYWSGLPCLPPGSSPPRDWTQVSCVSCTAGGLFTCWASREAWLTMFYFKMTFLIFWKITFFFFQRSKTIPWPSPLNSHLPKRHLQQSTNSPIWNDLIWQRTKIPINFILIDSTVWCLEKLMTQKKIWQECFQIRGKLQNFWLCTK